MAEAGFRRFVYISSFNAAISAWHAASSFSVPMGISNGSSGALPLVVGLGFHGPNWGRGIGPELSSRAWPIGHNVDCRTTTVEAIVWNGRLAR